MSYLNSYQKGAIFYQKHKLFYTTQEFKNNHTPNVVNNVVQEESAIEKLKKLKEIYDLNIITEEEYEEKRNKLLQEI